MPKIFSEWNVNKGFSDVTNELRDFCPIFLPISSVQSEILARLILEINNNTMRNNHILVPMSGKKLTSVERHKNAAARRLTFKDVVKSTFTLLLNESCNLSIPNDSSTPPPVVVPVGNRMVTKSIFSVAKNLDWDMEDTGGIPKHKILQKNAWDSIECQQLHLLYERRKKYTGFYLMLTTRKKK